MADYDRSAGTSEISSLSDEELVERARSDNEVALEELIGRYKGSVLSKARTYFLIGADREDIIQEGMIGLIKAIRDYKSDRLVVFRAFAEICITRQIITAIKTATRQKHIPLNSYISLSRPLYDDENNNQTLLELIESDASFNPEERMLVTESYKGVDQKIYKLLSKFERQVLEYYLSGRTYLEISDATKKSAKSVDNALQRIKRKLEKYYTPRRK